MELTDYISAGYFLSRYTGERDCTGIRLRRITMAREHSQRRFFPHTWAIPWCGDDRSERIERAADFGVPEADLDAVLAWADASFGTKFGAWSVFFSLGHARAAAAAMLGNVRDLDLWGVGLHRDLARSFCDATRPPPPEPGFAPMGASGVHIAVCQRPAPLADGGVPLGYEVLIEDLGCEFNSPESRHLDEVGASRAAGIAVNADGLFESLEDALSCCRQLPGVGEDAPPYRCSGWLPWLLVRYPLD